MLRKAIVLLIGVLSMWFMSCNSGRPLSAGSGITVEDKKSEQPAFERVYNSRVNSNVSMTVTIKNAYGSRAYTTAELTQNNGKWVLFEPESPADKILDRDLLPLVQSLCDQILSADKLYRSDPAKEFTDTSGSVWVRK